MKSLLAGCVVALSLAVMPTAASDGVPRAIPLVSAHALATRERGNAQPSVRLRSLILCKIKKQKPIAEPGRGGAIMIGYPASVLVQCVVVNG